MKKRKFGDGGEVPPGGRFDADTYARARKWMEAGSPKSSDNTSKSESKPAAKPVSKPAPKASYSNEGRNPPKPSGSDDIPKDSSIKAPAASGRSMSDLERNVRNTLNASVGFARIPGIASRAATKTTSTALAKSETPVTFLGASGRKNVTPKSAISGADKPRLEYAKSAERVSQKEGPKTLPPAKAAVKEPKRLESRKNSGFMPPKQKTKTKEKVSPRSRTKFESYDDVEFKSGGKVRGTGAATKGKKFSGTY